MHDRGRDAARGSCTERQAWTSRELSGLIRRAGSVPQNSAGQPGYPEGRSVLRGHRRADALRDVYWIGGGSGAGKSTVARRLADRYGLRRYATDDVMADHGRRMAREDSPLLRAFGAMDMDERWVSRSPQVMLETFGWFRGEGFGLIVDDLR